MQFDLNPIQDRRGFLRTVKTGAVKTAATLAVPNPLGLNQVAALGHNGLGFVLSRTDPAFVQRVKMIHRIKDELGQGAKLDETQLSERQILYFAKKVCKLIYNPSLTETQARRSLRGVISFITGSSKVINLEDQKLFDSHKENMQTYWDRYEALSESSLEILKNSNHDFIRNIDDHTDDYNDFSHELGSLMWSLAWNYELDLEKAKKDIGIFITQYCLAGEFAEPLVSSSTDGRRRENKELFQR